MAASTCGDLADDPRYLDATARLQNSAALIGDLDAAFAARPLSEWAERFDEHDVWWAPVQSIVDVIADPQAQPGFVEMTPRDGEEPYRAVATPVDFDGYEAASRVQSPRLGRAHRLRCSTS